MRGRKINPAIAIFFGTIAPAAGKTYLINEDFEEAKFGLKGCGCSAEIGCVGWLRVA